MIGALLTKRLVERGHVPNAESMNPSHMDKWADDVTLTPMGCPPIRGKAAVMAYDKAYYDTMTSYHVTTRSVSLAKPWAIGFTNTVVIEDEMTIERKDGRTQTLHQVLVLELKRGKIAAVRAYLADPDYEKVILDIEQLRCGLVQGGQRAQPTGARFAAMWGTAADGDVGGSDPRCSQVVQDVDAARETPWSTALERALARGLAP